MIGELEWWEEEDRDGGGAGRMKVGASRLTFVLAVTSGGCD